MADTRRIGGDPHDFRPQTLHPESCGRCGLPEEAVVHSEERLFVDMEAAVKRPAELVYGNHVLSEQQVVALARIRGTA